MIFDHPRCVEYSELTLQLRGIFGRRADRIERPVRIEIDRRGVQLKNRLGPNKVEPNDAFDRLKQAGFELHFEPVAPFTLAHFQKFRLPFRTDDGPFGRGFGMNGDLAIKIGSSLVITRADKMRADRAVIFCAHADHLLAFPGHDLARRSVERRCSQSPAQVGHAHPCQHTPTDVVRRVRARTAKNGGRDSGLREQFPERPAAAQIYSFRRQISILLLVSIKSQIGEIGLRITADEIENAVAARIYSCGECRPRDRRLRRIGGLNARVPTLRSEPGKMRQFAGFQQRIYDLRLETVQPDNDYFFHDLQVWYVL